MISSKFFRFLSILMLVLVCNFVIFSFSKILESFFFSLLITSGRKNEFKLSLIFVHLVLIQKILVSEKFLFQFLKFLRLLFAGQLPAYIQRLKKKKIDFGCLSVFLLYLSFLLNLKTVYWLAIFDFFHPLSYLTTQNLMTKTNLQLLIQFYK